METVVIMDQETVKLKMRNLTGTMIQMTILTTTSLLQVDGVNITLN
jgi:hypothetical protein